MFEEIFDFFRAKKPVIYSPIPMDRIPERVKDVFQLVDIICSVYDNPEYKPRDGRTFCNFAAYDIAHYYGVKDFPRKMANELADYLFSSDDWTEIPLKECQPRANQGTLIFAVKKDIPHGHICVIRPGNEKESGKWTKVPSCMNIGKENFISKGLSFAFADLPKFYAWKKSL